MVNASKIFIPFLLILISFGCSQVDTEDDTGSTETHLKYKVFVHPEETQELKANYLYKDEIFHLAISESNNIIEYVQRSGDTSNYAFTEKEFFLSELNDIEKKAISFTLSYLANKTHSTFAPTSTIEGINIYDGLLKVNNNTSHN